MVADARPRLKCASLTARARRSSFSRMRASGRIDAPRGSRALARRRFVRDIVIVASLAALALAGRGAASIPAQGAPTAAAATPRAPSIVLPDGPTARAYASSPSTGGTVGFIGIDPPAIDVTPNLSGAWRSARTWTWWSTGMRLAANPDRRDAQTRARLSFLALAHGRWSDAWMHFRACDAWKEWMTALLPSFLPGVPPGTKLGTEAMPTLRDGVELRPSLPPPSDKAEPGRIDVRAMKIESFVVGNATLSMRVAVEVEGVQIDIDHRSGGEAHLSIVIPEPEDFAIANEYVDWMVQETHHAPLALEIKPGDETHTIYGRFEARALTHPTHAPENVPAQLRGGVLWLLVPGGGANRAFFDAVAKSLRALPLELDCRVITADAGSKRDANDAARGTTVDLRAAGERDEKLKWLVSSIERFLLAKDRTLPR